MLIDANVAGDFNSPISAVAGYVIKKVAARECQIALGGQCSEELVKHENMRKILVEWSRSGRAKVYPKNKLEEEEKQLKRQAHHKSNDLHMIALARISGARVLYTNDGNLIDDFKNRNLIFKPKGKIYRYDSHKPLLDSCNKCK